MTFIIVLTGTEVGLGHPAILTLMRLMRLTRMARLARLLRALPDLLILIKGMLAATRAVCVTLFLLLIIIYVFGVLFRQLAADTEVGPVWFASVTGSMHNLIITGIQYDGPTGLMNDIRLARAYQLIPPFYLFVLLGSLTVMNMLIGVLCEVISAVASCEYEELQIYYVRERLQEIVDRQCPPPEEEGADLKIDKEHFLKILTDEHCAGLLSKVKVDPFGLVELVDTLFTNELGDELVLHVSDIVELIMDQRSVNIATVKDVTDFRKFSKGRLDHVEVGVEAKSLAMGRLLERGLGMPQGTWEIELAKARVKQKENKEHAATHHQEEHVEEDEGDPEVAGQEGEEKPEVRQKTKKYESKSGGSRAAARQQAGGMRG